MKVLLVSGAAFPSIGGIENSLRYIGEELIKLGHTVKIFCFKIHPDEPVRKVYDGIEIIRCDKYVPCRWPPKNLRQFVSLTHKYLPELLDEFQPDAVWSRYAPAGLGTRLAGYSGKLIHIFSTTARLRSRGTFLKFWPMPIKRRALLWVAWPFSYRASFKVDYDLLHNCEPVVFSEMMKHQMLLSYGSAAEKVRVIRPGVDTAFFSSANGASQIQEITSKYGLDPNGKYVLFVGRLSVEKDIPLLIDSLKYIKKSARLILVGSGPEETRLRHYVKKQNLDELVIFAGQHYQLLPGFYTLAKVCVLPTLIESFGQTLLESLACGTPVVAFSADGHKVINATDEIVQDGKTGRVVRNVSPQGLAEGINDILALSPTEYKVMSERAVADVTERFSWRRFVTEVLAL